MSLVLGSRLGPYEVVAAIGAGGMGEVYRAEDSRLGRTVAIKVLPSSFFQVPERRKRMEREARLLSSLSHPHICHLYDIGQQDGVDYIVMEFLEGETLSARLSKGPLSGEQVLTFGSEIADALDYAHRHGIVHRDLKPGNIMITRQGTKLLDFGLARMDEEAAPPASETLTRVGKSDRKLTEEGVILGTFQYMAPEQLEGKDADARTDIFALGALLYEMATGKPAFAGKTRASLIASILASEPAPITSLQPLSPPALERVIESCLAKDPDARWQSAQDVNLQLKWIRESGSGAGVPVPVAQRRKMREQTAWLLAGLLGVIALTLGVREIVRRPTTPAMMRFVIEPPPGQEISDFPPVRISPDGRQLVFAGIDAQGASMLWIRAFDSTVARQVPGTEGAGNSVWSPDGRFLIFDADGKLKKVDTRGGLPENLCDIKAMYPYSWSPSGVFLLALDSDQVAPGPIQSMSPDDCRIQPATKLDAARYDFGHQWPHFLPDGRHFLYSGLKTDKRHDVLLGTLGSFDSEVLVHNASDPKYAPPGYLFFERNGYLFAQPFSLSTLKVSGEPVQVEADQLMFAGLGGIADYDVMPGVLVFEKQQEVRNQLKIIDSTGKQIEALDVPGAYSGMRVSADRTKLLVSKMNLQFHSSDLWAYDLNHQNWERFTFDSSAGEHLGVWSPDGQTVIYNAFTKGHTNLFRKTRSGEAQVLLEDNFDKDPADWSSDGRFLLFVKADVNGTPDLWVYPLKPQGKPYPITETRFNELNARFSPDVRWIAYNSDESGQREVYVRPFPGPGERQQISIGGGRRPRWSRDGHKLYYETLDSRLMEVPVTAAGRAFQIGSARVLSALPKDSELEPFSDGKFLLNEQIGKLGSLPIVTLNWEAALSKARK
jgi:Tol biopolymer transport system component/tRNA A-37 threonylcarbamoyl transferase component Bud32